MTLVKRLHGEARQQLREAKQTMEALASLSDDWTAKTILDNEFASLEQTCDEFCLNQFGPEDR